MDIYFLVKAINDKETVTSLLIVSNIPLLCVFSRAGISTWTRPESGPAAAVTTEMLFSHSLCQTTLPVCSSTSKRSKPHTLISVCSLDVVPQSRDLQEVVELRTLNQVFYVRTNLRNQVFAGVFPFHATLSVMCVYLDKGVHMFTIHWFL